jgi:hypothetical protein
MASVQSRDARPPSRACQEPYCYAVDVRLRQPRPTADFGVHSTETFPSVSVLPIVTPPHNSGQPGRDNLAFKCYIVVLEAG